MSVFETVFWFAVVPLLIALVVGGLAYAGGRPNSDTGGKRYRPGRPYEAAPVWFLSAVEKAAAVAVAGEAQRPALTSGGGERHAAPQQGSTGGASDRW
ncbi:hypothetical protein [Actinophytocola sp.]|uniref:aa3-type cytochrome oxidase subunit CtaJ n=1 Tax=Actinophytocola sp. TaxID=1872138 RepID=UPI002D804599|nr:hypothetical protein [Actinophytocola sp.]HET9141902.1 hypothetical protein [Actinophytocola sp.]